jgi:hypothetical protein
MDAINALSAAVRANVPALIWGAPGIGKTAHIRKLSESLGWPLYEVVASIREPSDFCGYPVPVNGHVRLVPSAEWQDFAAHVEKTGAGILFLTEISNVAPAIQAALMRVVLDRQVGELQLPKSTRIVCDANPTAMAAGGWDLAPPLANRLLHFDWPTPSAEEWGSWLFSESVRTVEESRRWQGAEGQRVRALLAGFVHRQPGLLLDVPGDDESRGKAWPSPRSWEACARALSEVVDPHPAELPLDMLGLIGSASVGKAAAASLTAWAKDADLPDPEEVLAKPSAWRVDTSRQDRVFATLGSVFAAVVAKLDNGGKIPAQRWKAAWSVFGRADEAGAAAAGTAALAIPLAKAAAPGGIAYNLPEPKEVIAAQAIRREALGLPPAENAKKGKAA